MSDTDKAASPLQPTPEQLGYTPRHMTKEERDAMVAAMVENLRQGSLRDVEENRRLGIPER